MTAITSKQISENSHRGESHECEECGKTCYDMYSLSAHQRIHTGDKPFKCKEWKSILAAVTNKKTLIIHTGVRPFECKECGNAFYVKSTLITHQRIHTGENPCKCKGCGKAFHDKPSLIRHQKILTM